jgi:arylsulfatase A-like enzyme
MTGRYASRFGAQHRTFSQGRPQAVPLNETILAERLKARGFRTALVGKCE